MDRYKGLDENEQEEFKSTLTKFVRAYTFLTNIIRLDDAGLHKFHAYAKFLQNKLPKREGGGQVFLDDEVALQYYRVQKIFEGSIAFPALAEATEKLRENMIIFRYQLNHIAKGKRSMRKYIKSVSPELERYTGLVQQIKDKTKERKNLLAETPFYQLPKLHDLSQRIAELTEELEELKSEKAALLNALDCTDDVGISDVKKQIATMETALKNLEKQESKYSAELEDALKQYADLKAQAADVDAVELMDARLDIRPDRERSAADRVKAAYGDKYDPLMMYDSKRDVFNLLNEEAEARPVREFLRRKQQQQARQKQNKKKSRDSWER